MLESLDFHYDGISSLEMGLTNVRTDSGLFEEIFLPARSIVKERVKGNVKSYLQDIENEDLTIPLTFLMPEGYTKEEERAIKKWLYQSYYKPFYFDDYPEKVFYLMYDGEFRIFHNGNGQGYVTLEMVSDSPFAYSQVINPAKLTVNNTTTGVNYSINNEGDFPLYPELWIKMNSHNSVKIINNTNGIVFEFTGLGLTETLYIDNEREEIETDLALTYRFDNFNNNWLKLEEGINNLTIIGKCDVTFKYQFTYLV